MRNYAPSDSDRTDENSAEIAHVNGKGSILGVPTGDDKPEQFTDNPVSRIPRLDQGRGSAYFGVDFTAGD
jgi:hypothetical protein